MTKRKRLNDMMKNAAKPTQDASLPDNAASSGQGADRTAKSRNNTVVIGAHFPLAVRQQLKIIAAENDKSIQQCLAEALNLLFAAHGKAEVAPITTKTG